MFGYYYFLLGFEVSGVGFSVSREASKFLMLKVRVDDCKQVVCQKLSFTPTANNIEPFRYQLSILTNF